MSSCCSVVVFCRVIFTLGLGRCSDKLQNLQKRCNSNELFKGQNASFIYQNILCKLLRTFSRVSEYFNWIKNIFHTTSYMFTNYLNIIHVSNLSFVAILEKIDKIKVRLSTALKNRSLFFASGLQVDQQPSGTSNRNFIGGQTHWRNNSFHPFGFIEGLRPRLWFIAKKKSFKSLNGSIHCVNNFVFQINCY